MIIWLGILASLGTAFSWSLATIINTETSSHVGIIHFFMMRQPVAAIMLGIVALLAGQFTWYPPHAIIYTGLSGILGLIFCDYCLYRSVPLIGIRSAMICQCLYSCWTAVFGTIFLHEYLGIQGILGLLIATAGVILVITHERKDAHTGVNDPGQRRLGLILGLASGVFMAIGLVLSKQALNDGIPPVMLACIRNAASWAVLWICAGFLGHLATAWAAAKAYPAVLKRVPLGCLFGPAGGVWLSTVALDILPAAVASTLIGMQPIALLILTGIRERRIPARGSILGSILACAGAALLILR